MLNSEGVHTFRVKSVYVIKRVCVLSQSVSFKRIDTNTEVKLNNTNFDRMWI